MFITSTPKRADLWYASDDAISLIIACVAADNSATVEIGKHHIYASRKGRGLISKRRDCDLQVRMKRRTSVNAETAEKINLREDKIGELSFCPPIKKNEVTSALPASLEAIIFLDDELFDGLISTLSSGRVLEWLRLDLEKGGPLAYGWEPDGSRIEWKIDNPSDPPHVDVASIAIGFKLFRA